MVSGYDCCTRVTRNVVLLWPAYPILLFGKWFRLGTTTYGWIAGRRHTLLGAYTKPSGKRPARSLDVASDDFSQLTVTRAMLALVVEPCELNAKLVENVLIDIRAGCRP